MRGSAANAEARSLMFSKAEDKDKNQAEYERVQRIVTEARAADERGTFPLP